MIESAKRCICTLKKTCLGEILETLRQNCHAYFKEAIYFSLLYGVCYAFSNSFHMFVLSFLWGLTSKTFAVEPLCFFFLSLRLHYLFTQVREEEPLGIRLAYVSPLSVPTMEAEVKYL